MDQDIDFMNFYKVGGDPAGTRTQDNSIKSRVLYQLSYGIILLCCSLARLGRGLERI